MNISSAPMSALDEQPQIYTGPNICQNTLVVKLEVAPFWNYRLVNK